MGKIHTKRYLSVRCSTIRLDFTKRNDHSCLSGVGLDWGECLDAVPNWCLAGNRRRRPEDPRNIPQTLNRSPVKLRTAYIKSFRLSLRMPPPDGRTADLRHKISRGRPEKD